MIEGQYEPSIPPHILRPHRSRLLRQHPVLLPIILICCAIGLCTSSFFADTIFPILAIFGASPAVVCLALALVTAIAGILAGIVGIIERFDRYHLQAGVFPRPKEQSYANRN